VSLRVDRVQIAGRPAVEREVVEHPGSVVIVPETGHGTVLLVRQWRHAIGRELLECPAGTRDVEDESPKETAQRELQEETGYGAAVINSLPGFWVAPGWCNEYMHAFVASGLSPAHLPQDDDEDVRVEEVALSRVPALIRSGEIQDAKSIAALLSVIVMADNHGPGD